MAEATAQIGQLIGDRYRITGVLGTGGMGSVYRAEHVGIRRLVAIKLLHRELAEDPTFARRFEREAFVSGQAAHPNCINVSDFGRLDDGSLYLVMELVDGVLLGDLLDAETRLDWRRAFRIARHVLRGLAHAHQAAIIHRDVKPDNVIVVGRDGDAEFSKLLDFGIAKLVEDAASPSTDNQITRIGTTVGTPTYVAPEQALGQHVDGRSDLYSLSVMLFEMIAGDPPYKHDDTLKMLSLHVAGAIPTIASRGVSVPAPVEAIVARGLSKDPADRFASADEYLAAVEAVLEGSQTAIPAAPAAEAEAPGGLLAGWSQRRKLAVAAGGALALVVILAIAISGPSPPPDPEVTAAVRRDPSARLADPLDPIKVERPSQLARTAADHMKRGDPRAAIAVLEAARAEASADPDAQLQLGHAYAAVNRLGQAIAAYKMAVMLDEPLGDDPKLRANVSLAADSDDPSALLAGLDFQVLFLKDDAATARLVELASTDKRLAVRKRARELAEQFGASNRVDALSSYSLDLIQEATCEARRDALLHLAELADRRAIEPIRRARDRRRGGFLGFGAKRVNTCLIKEADEALEKLRTLPAPATPP